MNASATLLTGRLITTHNQTDKRCGKLISPKSNFFFLYLYALLALSHTHTCLLIRFQNIHQRFTAVLLNLFGYAAGYA